MIRRIVLVAMLAVCSLPAQVQTPAPEPSSPKEQAKISTYTLPPDKLAKAIEYARARHVLYFAGVAYGVVIMLGILAFQVAPRFRNWAENVTRRRIVQAYIFAPSSISVLS